MSELKEFDINDFYIGENLYIEASAGTGKTYTIELLVEKMLQNRIPLSKILIVTFTEKATGELRDRIRKKVISCLEKDPNNSTFTKALQEVGNAQIFTIHSFCQNVLKHYAYETKSSLNLQQVYDNNIDNIVDRFIRDKWKNNKDFQILLDNDCDYSVLKSQFINTINDFSRFSKIEYGNSDFNNNISPIDKFVFEHFKDLIEEWQNYKKNNNLITFADMINLVHECICDKNNEIATTLSEIRNDEHKNRLVERLREVYKYAIIDEFQDTNQKQWDIFKKIFLESDTNNIIVVGDPKQSIFSFQGAEIDVYKKAIDEIGNGRRLSTNYRSSEVMISACNALFDEEIYIKKEIGRSSNKKVEIVKNEDCFFGNSKIVFNESGFPKNDDESKNKKAFLNGNEIEPIWLAEPSDELEYAKYAVTKMVECLKCDENGKTALQIYDKNEKQIRSVKFSDFAVLARARAEMPYIEDEMRKVGIPFYRYKDKTLFDGKECKEWIAILRLLDVPDFASYNRKILNHALLTDFFRKKLDEVDCEEFVNPTKKPMCYILEWKKLAEKRRWAELKERIFEDTEIDKYLSSNLLSESFIKICQIGNYIFDYLFNHKVSIEEMIKHLNGLVSKTEGTESEDDLIENANDLDAVRIMTIHSSKGLEFPIVVMVGSLSNYPKNLSKPFVYCKDKKKYLGYDTESKKN
jgi:exodeoxyribonuclease V beta subunit